MTGLRAFLLASLGGVVLCGLAPAAPAFAGSEPGAETRSKAEAGDPFAQWQLGEFYRQRNQPGDAEKSYALFQKSMLGYSNSDGPTSDNTLAAISSYATAADMLGRYDAAVKARELRVEILTGRKPGSPDLASAYWDLANALQSASRFEESVKPIATACAIYGTLGQDHAASFAGCLVSEGYSLDKTGRKAEAMARYQAALDQYGRMADPPAGDMAIALSNLAIDQFAARDYAMAAQTYGRHIALLRKTAPQSLDLALSLESQAQAFTLTRRFAESLPLIEEARALQKHLGDDAAARANLMLAEGTAREGLEQFDAALLLYQDAATVYEEAPGSPEFNRAVAYERASNVLQTLSRYAEAEDRIKQAIAIYEKLSPGDDSVGLAVEQLGLIEQKLSRYRESLDPIRRARAIFIANDGPVHEFVGDTWLNEGMALEGLNDFPAALDAYGQAARIYASVGEKARLPAAYVTNNIAWVHRRMKEYALAEKGFREALPVLEARLGPTNLTTNKVVINIGIVTQKQGKNDEAIRWSMRALANLNRAEAATLDDQRWTYDTLSKAFKDRGDPKRAILFAKLAINAQQKIRANNKEFKADDLKDFKQEWRFLYQDLADLLIGQGRLAEAQATLNMEKEEELSDFVRRDASADLRDSQAALTPKEDAQLADVDTLLAQPIAAAGAVSALLAKQQAGGLSAEEEKRLATLQGSLDSAYSGFMDEVDAFLKATDAEDVGVQKEVEAINLDYVADMQEELRALGGKAAMLQIASLGDATHLFFTVPDASVHREVKIGREELARMVFDALDAIERRDPKVNDKMQALYHVLVEPVAGDLKASGAETLMLNLQGFLRYVPFAALYDGRHYLVEDYALSLYTPAARTAFAAADRDPEKSAGFGVTAAHPGFAPLPGVAREIEAIFGDPGKPGALAGAASLDGGFTRDAFRAALQKRPEIVHIASHFKLVPGRETDSFLLLGDGSPLSLSDIRKGRGFRFGGVDLITLSACETARGGDGDGDEVESFGALAQMNGASSVMATLWPVADEATAALMKSFYRHMVEEKMSKADALRAAQIEAIRGGGGGAGKDERGGASLVETAAARPAAGPEHPYFWSPFVLMGNWM